MVEGEKSNSYILMDGRREWFFFSFLIYSVYIYQSIGNMSTW